MRRLFLSSLIAVGIGVAPAGLSGQAVHTPPAKITLRQARRIAVLVARHDSIDLSDADIEMNSMDLGRDFIRGFASFILIRESATPGPDETLRRYAISRSTGDVWEISLCTHYDFPELTAMRRLYAGRAEALPADVAAQSRELGCTEAKPVPQS
jgi:Effector immunity protein Tgi2PP